MQITMNIGAVERDTGISKDALRVWERRYGFPDPVRDGLGERAYLPEQVDKLRLLKRLLDLGYRPGKIIHYSVGELTQLVSEAAARGESGGAVPANARMLQEYLALCKGHQSEALRLGLTQALSRMGLERFIADLLVPLNHLVGEGWANGTMEIHEEHLYTECVQIILRTAISSLQPLQTAGAAGPRILLTTVPQEQHGLGLLMAEAMMVMEGATCVSLGVQTPIADIVAATHAHRADVTALSFSGAMPSRQVLDGLRELRQRLSPEVELWVGGTCPVLTRLPSSPIHILRRLADIRPAIDVWRASHSAKTLIPS